MLVKISACAVIIQDAVQVPSVTCLRVTQSRYSQVNNEPGRGALRSPGPCLPSPRSGALELGFLAWGRCRHARAAPRSSLGSLLRGLLSRQANSRLRSGPRCTRLSRCPSWGCARACCPWACSGDAAWKSALSQRRLPRSEDFVLSGRVPWEEECTSFNLITCRSSGWAGFDA